jgi:inosine-uridine nucleoside N-ribohydrolase
MIETQLAASLLSSKSGGIPGQPEPTRENLKSVTTRGGKTTQDPPHPNPARKKQKEVTTESDEVVDTMEASPGEERSRETTPQE